MKIDKSIVAQRTAALQEKQFYSDNGVVKTPLVYSKVLSELCRCNLYFKCENLQNTGSFKVRGATSAMLNLSESDKVKGVITASSGNHGAATAMAAKTLGIPVTIYVPTSISAAKEEKILSCGATLIKVPGVGDNAERQAAADAKEQGLTYISPYNDLNIMAGQGTLAPEILEDLPDVDAIFISVGGGGLISGIGSWMKTRGCDANKNVDIVGCWPENAPAMLECMKAGRIIEVPEKETLSDGTAGGIEEGAITLSVCQDVISATTTVTETEIADAMKSVFEHHHYKVEGAAGVALAGLLKNTSKYKNKNVVVLLCGGNISEDKFNSIVNIRG
ncbi:Threonine dehydratase [Photobacterium marinum]|uniref:Threonine dehydratase n=1 Tax=Photobacterium marinum TaxID=1056511 RepID=L8JDY8_9GAMM|nr:threonine/serine dehydratase [Photobacterium marinum]ELR65622.1 Threonine dehydratase [Photobacterium marinum]